MDDTLEFPKAIEGVPDPRQHDALIGHEANRRLLEASFAHERVPQAWLLQGTEGIGKASFAWHYARRLVEYGDPLAQIPAQTMEHYARGSQSAIFDVSYAKDDKGGFKSQITIDAIRALGEKLAMASDTKWRVVIIDPAEAMNANAANALLKLLEEPPEHCLFFLISHAPHKLLPTIQSRCQKLRFQELSRDEMKSIWQAVSEEPLPDETRFDLADGSIRMALEMNDDLSQIYENMLEMFRPGMARSNIQNNTTMINKGQRAQALERANLLFSLLFGRLARIRAGTASGNPQEAKAAEAIAPSKLAEWAELSQSALEDFDQAQRLNLDAEATILNQWYTIDKFLRKP